MRHSSSIGDGGPKDPIDQVGVDLVTRLKARLPRNDINGMLQVAARIGFILRIEDSECHLHERYGCIDFSETFGHAS